MIGLIVTCVGLFSPESRAPLGDVNVNLYSGLAMMAFGAFMLALAWHAKRSTGA
jgi:hypothetical protein